MAMARDVVVLSGEQFDKLVELLTPGYECAKLMLADYQNRAAYEGQREDPAPDDRTPEQIAADAARQSELDAPASD